MEEYAARPGEVRPISDALAALICFRKGRAEISAKGIKIERKDIGGVRIYHHVDSRLCNDLSQRERKIFYVLNSMKPDIVHLLDETGRYIESLPEKFQPGVLNNEEQAREYADQKRQFNRVARHLQELHGDDTKQAIADLQQNNAIAHRIVQVMPSGQSTPDVQPAPSALGDRILSASTTINNFRKQQKATMDFGRAVSASRNQRFEAPATVSANAEDWSSPRHDSTPTTKEPESW